MRSRFWRECIGAETIEAMDFSPYEGAMHIQVMNEPVPDKLVERFDAVIDGGSLEHIFNFPVAVSNLMRMAKVGGRVFMVDTCEQLSGPWVLSIQS